MSDIGADINAQMAAAPSGATIQLPQGAFPFSTRIQCPVDRNATYRIEGVARQSYTTGIGGLVNNCGGTTLIWKGSGTAIDQTITDPNYNWQSLKGCEFRHFSLINQGDPGSMGIAFGATQHTVLDELTISGFTAGVYVTNPQGGTTERYKIHALLEDNIYGIQFYAYAGGSNSFGYGDIDIDLLLRASPTGRAAVFVDGQLQCSVYNSLITIRGNVFANASTAQQQYIFFVGGNGAISNNAIKLLCECNGTGFCGIYQNWGQVLQNNTVAFLQQYNGQWNSVGKGTS